MHGCARNLCRSMLLVALACAPALLAEEHGDVRKSTYELRAALHGDPTLEAPYRRLVEAWRDAGKLADLVEMYRDHLRNYPQDRSSAAVYLRLLLDTNDPGLAAMADAVVQTWPDDAWLRSLRAESLLARKDPGALDEFERAVQREEDPGRKAYRLQRLIDESLRAGRQDVAERALVQQAQGQPTPSELVAIATSLIGIGAHNAAAPLLKGMETAGVSEPDVMVAVQAALAECDIALGQRVAAVRRLDALLEKLAADHWRRAELSRRRLLLAADGAERETLIAQARARVAAAPGDEAAVIDCAAVLQLVERRDEAVTVLLEASARLPQSIRIEEAVLAMFLAGDDRAGAIRYVEQRLQREAQRADLRLTKARLLFELGSSASAAAEVERAQRDLPAAERLPRVIALARTLRRGGLTLEAADVFARAATGAVPRYDLNREQAECLIAAGDRRRAMALFADEPPAGISGETVVDVVGFLVREKRPDLAARWVAAYLARDPGHFMLRLEAISLAGRMGDGARAEALASTARTLADTSGRYRAWLEAAVDGMGAERAGEWLKAEAQAVESATDARRASRLAAVADIAGQAGQEALSRDLLTTLLSGGGLNGLANDEQNAARRRYLDLVSSATASADSSVALRAVADQDPGLSNEVEARLLIMAQRSLVDASQGGMDMQPPLSDEQSRFLINLEPTSILNVEVARGLVDVARRQSLTRVAQRWAERVCLLEPTTIDNWNTWLMIAGARGDDTTIRLACRRLLAGVKDVTLKPEIQQRLRTALIAASWRAVARSIASMSSGAPAARMHAGQASAAAAAALEALAQGESMATTDQDRAWLWYTRAWLHQSLGHRAERDRVVARLDALALTQSASNASPSPGTEKKHDLHIAFPDGLTGAWSVLRPRLLAVSQTPPAPAQPDRATTPAMPWKLGWSFKTAGAVRLVVSASQSLVVSDGSSVWGLAANDGRVRWSTDGLRAVPSVVGDRVIIARADGIQAVHRETGEVLWVTTACAGDQTATSSEDSVLVFHAESGLLTALAADSGRIRWSISIPKLYQRQDPDQMMEFQGSEPVISLVCDGSTAVISGPHMAVVDVTSGTLLWWIDPERGQPSAPDLNETAASTRQQPNPSTMMSTQYGHYSPSRYGRHGRHSPSMYYPQAPTSAKPMIDLSTAISNEQAALWMQQAQRPTVFSLLVHRLLTEHTLRPGLERGRLLIGDGDTQMSLDLRLPVAALPMPPSTLVGSRGQRTVALTATGAISIDRGTGRVAALDLGRVMDLRAPPSETPYEVDPNDPEDVDPTQIEHALESPQPPVRFLSGFVDGRRLLVGGPGGVATVDIDAGDVVGYQEWPQGVEPAATLSWRGDVPGGWITGQGDLLPPIAGSDGQRIWFATAANQLSVLVTGSDAPRAVPSRDDAPSDANPSGTTVP